jgi:hypothetical protein
MIQSLGSEVDLEKRNETIGKIWQVVQDEQIYLPIHNQVLNWGMKSNIDFPVQPEDQPHFKFLKKTVNFGHATEEHAGSGDHRDGSPVRFDRRLRDHHGERVPVAGRWPCSSSTRSTFVDIPVMSAYLLLVAVIFVTINLIVDLLYFTIDPRLSVGSN